MKIEIELVMSFIRYHLMRIIFKFLLVTIFLFTLFYTVTAWSGEVEPLFDKAVKIDSHGELVLSEKSTSSQVTKQKQKTVKKQSKSVSKSNSKRLWEYKKSRFNLYSIDDEIKIGNTFQKKQVDNFKKKKLFVNPKKYSSLKKRMDNIVKRLAKQSDIPNLPYEVTLFDKKDMANAYCLPGGKMGVFTGIFKQVNKKTGMVDMNSDDEIAAVLSHEMAHATLRHVTRRLTTYNTLGLVGSIVTLGLAQGAGDNWARLANQVFNTGTFLYFPSYSRKHEKEADQVGLYYMAKAGFKPQAAVSVWKRAAKRASKKGKNDNQFFASHPSSGSRANTLQGYLADAALVQKQQKEKGRVYREMRR
ncbi:MAG: M48 family metallopeptidase [bacterium]|nr:M48 family metallopeptidase [bacterium]MBU1918781.1 M48 family metallopeptidase [bacterium]